MSKKWGKTVSKRRKLKTIVNPTQKQRDIAARMSDQQLKDQRRDNEVRLQGMSYAEWESDAGTMAVSWRTAIDEEMMKRGADRMLGKSKAIDQSKVIAIDLNGTLAGRGKDPEGWGEPQPDAAWAMQQLKDKGYILCVNSVVGDEDAIKGWLEKHDLLKFFDYVNESPAQPEGSSDKLNAVAMVDDRGWNYDGDWKRTLNGLFESGILEKSMKVAIKKQARRIVKRLDKGQHLEDKDDNSIWVLTTADMDRDGETVDPEGVDFSEFDINPVVLDNHNTDGGVTDVVLGKIVRHWLEEVGEGTKWPQVGGKARAAQLGEIEWNTSTQKGRDAQKMAKAGQLNGGSISFVPLDEPRKNASDGNHYAKVKLLEFTLCPVGSNPSAVRVKRLKQRLKGSNRYKLKAPLRRRKAGGMNVGDTVMVRSGSGRGQTGVIDSINGDQATITDFDGRTFKESVSNLEVAKSKSTESLASEVAEKAKRKSLEPGDTVDVQYLNNVLRGTVVAVQSNGVKVDVNGDVRTFDVKDVFETKAVDEDAIDDAMKDCGVPYRMQAAVKAIARKGMRLDERDWAIASPAQRRQYAGLVGLVGDDWSMTPWANLPRDVREELSKAIAKKKTYKRRSKMKKRKCWINKRLKTAWLLKSEGDPLTPKEEETLSDMGVEEVQVEDKEPESFEDWAEEEMEEVEHDKAARSVQDWKTMFEHINLNDDKPMTPANIRFYSDQITNIVEGEGESISDSEANQIAQQLCSGKALDNADKVEDIAEDVGDRTEEIVLAGAEEGAAISAAMVEGCVPLEMQPAVKAIVRRRMKRHRKSVEWLPVGENYQGARYDIGDQTPLGTVSKVGDENGQPVYLIQGNTYTEAEIAENKNHKRLRKSFGDDNQPLGLKALKSMIKAIEEAMKGPPALHKSEQPHVIDAGDRALKLLKAALKRAYKDSGEEDPEALKKGMRFRCKGKSYICKSATDVPVTTEDEEKDIARVVESNTGEFFLEDESSAGGRESYNNGPFATRAEALAAWRAAEGKAIRIGECPLCEAQWGPGDEEYAQENGQCPECEGQISGQALEKARKRVRSRKNKRLSKADTDVVKRAVETLESMADGSDLPKHLKGTVRGMAEDFKSLCKSEIISDDPDAEVPDDILQRLEKSLDNGDAAMKRFDDRLFSVTGIRSFKN